MHGKHIERVVLLLQVRVHNPVCFRVHCRLELIVLRRTCPRMWLHNIHLPRSDPVEYRHVNQVQLTISYSPRTYKKRSILWIVYLRTSPHYDGALS